MAFSGICAFDISDNRIIINVLYSFFNQIIHEKTLRQGNLIPGAGDLCHFSAAKEMALAMEDFMAAF